MRIKCIVNRDFKMSVEVGVAKSNTVKKLFSAPCQATDKAIKDKANQLPEAIIKHLFRSRQKSSSKCPDFVFSND